MSNPIGTYLVVTQQPMRPRAMALLADAIEAIPKDSLAAEPSYVQDDLLNLMAELRSRLQHHLEAKLTHE